MNTHIASPAPAGFQAWYERNRRRTRELFDLLDPAVYYSRPIALRNPIVFYEGHLPVFSVIAFLKRGLGAPGLDERLETLFARGIDPEDETRAVPRSGRDTRWPSRPEVLEYARRVDEAMLEALDALPTALAGGAADAVVLEGLYTALEHEAMHQETLLYMWRQLPTGAKRKPDDLRYERGTAPPRPATVEIPAGWACLGARRGDIPFGWDNEFEQLRVHVPAFDIDVHSVTNAEFLAFVADDGYTRRELWTEEGWNWVSRAAVRHPAFWDSRDGEWFWRGMFEDLPLPLAWPVYVSQAEADAYARWKGRRLPTEPEFHRAAFGSPTAAGGTADSHGAPQGVEREHPWGAEPPSPVHGNFDFVQWEPVPAGARPAGASAWGVHDLAGNGWEWTSTRFAPFPGFAPMRSYPEYSAEFFDGQHYVMKGASPGTARELVRRSFRNWFRGTYPYVYGKFRTAQGNVEK